MMNFMRISIAIEKGEIRSRFMWFVCRKTYAAGLEITDREKQSIRLSCEQNNGALVRHRIQRTLFLQFFYICFRIAWLMKEDNKNEAINKDIFKLCPQNASKRMSFAHKTISISIIRKEMGIQEPFVKLITLSRGIKKRMKSEKCSWSYRK